MDQAALQDYNVGLYGETDAKRDSILYEDIKQGDGGLHSSNRHSVYLAQWRVVEHADYFTPH